MLFFATFVALLASSVGLAGWKGGAPERVVGFMFLTAWLISVALFRDLNRYVSADWISFGINLALALGLFCVALIANRSWPMLVSSLQWMIILAQLGRRVGPNWMWQVNMVMNAAWPYFQVMILLTGTIFHWRREARSGKEPSWSPYWKAL
ncbi:hypothetical protein [uncultured Sphingomonas sp.]|uniref:hypothetical protein n=1 Tax=uncultured Sphingomonas sp. TaxID=158754 RepID=UPI0035CC1548